MRGQQFKHPRACSRGTQAAMAAATGSCSQFLDVSADDFSCDQSSQTKRQTKQVDHDSTIRVLWQRYYDLIWYSIDGRSPAMMATRCLQSIAATAGESVEANTVQAALRAVLIHSVETSIPLSSKDSGDSGRAWKGETGETSETPFLDPRPSSCHTMKHHKTISVGPKVSSCDLHPSGSNLGEKSGSWNKLHT